MTPFCIFRPLAIRSLFLSATLALLAMSSTHGVMAQQATDANTSTGTLPDKIIFIFQKQKDPRSVMESATKVADFLTQETGTKVEVMVPTSYGASVQALISNKAHVAYVSALPFLLAKEEAPVRIIAAEVRNGRTDYDSIFVVAKDSPIQTLADAKGKRMVFTSPTSTSGYVMAFDRLIKDGLLKPGQDPKDFFSTVTFGGGYDRALLAVANGQADLAAVSDYTMEGAKADVYLPAAQRAKLRILTRNPGVPTHGICIRTDLPESFQKSMQDALLKLSKEKPELLSDVYGASSFTAVDNSHTSAAREAMNRTGLSTKKLVE